MPTTNNTSGFSLIESLVAALLVAVLAGVMYTIMTMNNNGVKNGAVSAKVQTQYEVAMAEIGAAARKASAVLAGGEAWPPVPTMTPTTTSKIVMYYQDAAGTVTTIRGFWVDNGVLKECSTGWTDGDYTAFKVGSWSTLSVPEATPFQLSASRKTLTISMSVVGTHSGMTDTAAARGEVFICRN